MLLLSMLLAHQKHVVCNEQCGDARLAVVSDCRIRGVMTEKWMKKEIADSSSRMNCRGGSGFVLQNAPMELKK